jgi:hypothetical protein
MVTVSMETVTGCARQVASGRVYQQDVCLDDIDSCISDMIIMLKFI